MIFWSYVVECIFLVSMALQIVFAEDEKVGCLVFSFHQCLKYHFDKVLQYFSGSFLQKMWRVICILHYFARIR